MPKKLTAKHELFVENYIKTKNATKAAIAAGFSEASARNQASRLMTNVHIKEAIGLKLDIIKGDVEISTKSVLAELKKGAFAEVDIKRLTHTEKLKYLEVLCKYLGILDGKGNEKPDSSDDRKGILGAISRIGKRKQKVADSSGSKD